MLARITFSFFLFFAAVSTAPMASGAERASDYPSKAVRIIVPTPPGGGLDVMARVLAQGLQERWNQPVVVQNKPGASMTIGAADVAESKPDGYTILFGMDAVFVSNTLLHDLRYDPETDLVPVSLLAKGDQFIVASKDLQADSLTELRDLAKKKSSTINFGSHALGSPTHIAFELMNKHEDLDMLHVLYQGIAPVMNALLAGEIQLSLVGGSVGGNFISEGRIKALASTGSERSEMFPNIPTVAEQGFPYMASSVWYALAVAKGTPDEIVEKISASVAQVVKDPNFVEKHVASKGMVAVGSTPKELEDLIHAERKSTRDMFRTAGITRESIQ